MFLLIFLISCRLIFLDPRTWVASTLRPTGPLRKNSVDRQTCEASRIFYLWCCRGRWSLEGHLRPPLQYTLFLKRKSRVNSVALGGYLPVSSYRLNGGWLNDVQMPRPSETTLLIWPFFVGLVFRSWRTPSRFLFGSFVQSKLLADERGHALATFHKTVFSPRVYRIVFSSGSFIFIIIFPLLAICIDMFPPSRVTNRNFFLFSLSLSLHPRQECVGVIIQQCARQVLTPPFPQTSGVQVGGKEKVERPENNHRHC